MNRYDLIMEEWTRLTAENAQLELEYKDQIKGNIYLQRKLDLVNKQKHVKNKALNIGTHGVVCKVSGKRQRPGIKNRTVLITERFNLYFIDVTEAEVAQLVKLHVKNLMSYKIEFFKPGIIMSTE